MEQVLQDINKATKGAFPNSIARYKSVHALLLSWEDDDLGIDSDVDELKTSLQTGYGYNAERWQIPSVKPDFALNRRLQDFRSDHDTEEQGDCLYIIYYAGHGYLDRTRRTMWSSRACSSEQPEPPRVKWHAQEALFTETIHDTLFLFDCCTAGSSSETTRFGIKEVIAACGFETWAPGDREHSFTKALITVLNTLVRAPPFTVASLHQQILETLKHWSPQMEPNQLLKIGLDGRLSDIERRKTPVHIALNQDPYYYHSSIQLVGQFTVATNPYKRSEESFAQWKDQNKEYTDVIISIRIQGDLDVDHFARWIRSVPLLALSIKVHCVVHKNPTMVLLAVPVAVWDLLPADTSYQFIGYANSPNLVFGKEYLFVPDPETKLIDDPYLTQRAREYMEQLPGLMTENVRKWFYDDYFNQLSKTKPDNLNLMYAANMQKFHIGHMLFEPESPTTVKPGACGYFSSDKWHSIQLSDMPQTRSPVAPVQLFPEARGSGSFRSSSSRRGDFYAYSLGSGWGAVFLPSRPITYNSVETDELLIWAHSNAQKILSQYPDVKQCGFYLVSGSYTTEKFQIVTRDAEAGGAFVVKQSGQGDDLSWAITSGGADTMAREYQEEAVISFQGLHFTYNRIWSQHPTMRVVEDPSDGDEQKSLYEFQYTPFIWPGDPEKEWKKWYW